MQTLDESRALLLDAVSGADVTFYRSEGNRGDDLIEAGTRALLDSAGIPYRFLYKEDIREYSGDLLIIGGGGGWCHYWRHSPSVVIDAAGFERIVVFPSTYDVTEPLTAHVLLTSGATFFARERVSAEAAEVAFAHCPSFFYPFRQRKGRGILHAFRTDAEAAEGTTVPRDNLDVASIGCSLDAWLALVSRYAEVHTDRAHVMVAAALLGKRVRWRPNGYFKVAAMAETLVGYDVEPL